MMSRVPWSVRYDTFGNLRVGQLLLGRDIQLAETAVPKLEKRTKL